VFILLHCPSNKQLNVPSHVQQAVQRCQRMAYLDSPFRLYRHSPDCVTTVSTGSMH